MSLVRRAAAHRLWTASGGGWHCDLVVFTLQARHLVSRSPKLRLFGLNDLKQAPVIVGQLLVAVVLEFPMTCYFPFEAPKPFGRVTSYRLSRYSNYLVFSGTGPGEPSPQRQLTHHPDEHAAVVRRWREPGVAQVRTCPTAERTLFRAP